MNKPTYKIEVNYDEAKLLSAALVALLKEIPFSPDELYPTADIDYLIGQIQDAMETLEEHCVECDACDGRCFNCDYFDSAKGECSKKEYSEV